MKLLIVLSLVATLTVVRCNQLEEVVPNRECGYPCDVPNRQCYRVIEDNGSEKHECRRNYCKDAPSCGEGYKCRERSLPCFRSGRAPDCQEFDCVLDDTFDTTNKNPCKPNPCGSYQACVSFPKFCCKAPCPQYACFGI